MNDLIRQEVKAALRTRGFTQTQLAEMTGIARPNITRLLSGDVGQIPENWQKILNVLDLEIVTRSKDSHEQHQS